MSTEYNLDNTPRVRRIMQSVMDLRRDQISGCRILDLGSAHGAFALEFARRGADAVGIEGRQSWVDHARKWQKDLGIVSAAFHQDDVKNVSVEKYGRFDVILCLGLLYHLDFSDALQLLKSMYNICKDFIILDTQIALDAVEERKDSSQQYFGWKYREHPEGASKGDKVAVLGASLEDEFSFWFTRPSLFNALNAAGFTSVMEVRNPIDNIYLNGEFKMHEDVITLVAMKGRPVNSLISHGDTLKPVELWPETIDSYILERPWTKPKVAQQPAEHIRPTASIKGRFHRLLGLRGGDEG